MDKNTMLGILELYQPNFVREAVLDDKYDFALDHDIDLLIHRHMHELFPHFTDYSHSAIPPKPFRFFRRSNVHMELPPVEVQEVSKEGLGRAFAPVYELIDSINIPRDLYHKDRYVCSVYVLKQKIYTFVHFVERRGYIEMPTIEEVMDVIQDMRPNADCFRFSAAVEDRICWYKNKLREELIHE